MRSQTVDIGIVGGGAAGLAAAITAARQAPSLFVMVLEKGDRPGRKVAASGNGRCNLTNQACPELAETLAFFSSLGLMTRRDEAGRYYPYSEDGRDVVEALVQEAKRLGVVIQTGYAVSSVERCAEGFLLKADGQATVLARKVLLAAGGKAGPAFGTTGEGAKLAHSLGVTVTKLAPALTAIDTVEAPKDLGLSGLRAKGICRLYRDHHLVAEEAGEIQFTDRGLSGICVMNLTRQVVLDSGESIADGMARYAVQVDLVPERSLEQLTDWMQEQESPLRSLVRRPLAQEIQRRTQDPGKQAGLLKAFPFGVAGLRGWDYAQVTRGGVSLEAVDAATMASRQVPGLYFAGEITDYDGPCGGFNLQYAWTSGIRAGRGMTCD